MPKQHPAQTAAGLVRQWEDCIAPHNLPKWAEEAALTMRALLPQPAAAVTVSPTDAQWNQTLHERDTYHEWADKLAAAAADHFQIDIGEHSSANNPWQEALDAFTGTPPEMLVGRLIDAWCASHGKQIPWEKAIEICAVITKMPDAEKQRLLHLDESDEPTPQTQGGA